MTSVAEREREDRLADQEQSPRERVPSEIVAALDEYIIGQAEAKRAVAVALRNRWRRLQIPSELREEITPKNIIMIGSTGVGKTEISRRLAKLADAPFAKVEASKFTEVGYVGRDVESIIRDLVDSSFTMEKEAERKRLRVDAERAAEEQLLDVLLPQPQSQETKSEDALAKDSAAERDFIEPAREDSTREKLRVMLREGKLEERLVEIQIDKQPQRHLEVYGPPGMGEVEGQFKEMFSAMMPKVRESKKLSIAEARKLLVEESLESLVDRDTVGKRAVQRAEQSGIVFIDEIDKICGSEESQRSADVSREGVQRDLLPLVEGSTVSTKYGSLHTDHILFIASGAFHKTKPSDLMPEFQGRFPIRVELQSLRAGDFYRILTEPKNALTNQYSALLKTEGVELSFEDDALRELARFTEEVNASTENIGARRLHTILEHLLDEISFSADEMQGQTVHITADYVRERLAEVTADSDLARFIL